MADTAPYASTFAADAAHVTELAAIASWEQIGRGDEQAGGDDRKQVAHVFTPQNQAFRPMTKRVCSGSPPAARVKSAVSPSSRLHSTPT